MSRPFDISKLRGPQFYKFRDCYFDAVERKLYKNAKRVEISNRALEVLHVLIEYSGEVVTKDDFIGQIWGESFVEEQNIAVHVSRLRKAFGFDESNPAIITEPGKGYRFVADVVEVDDDEWAEIIENELSPVKDGKKQYSSIAVMPLECGESDEDIEYLADGITENVINALSQMEDLRVISRNTVFSFKGKKIDFKKLGRRLRVAAILTGRIQLVKGRVIVRVELNKVSDGSQIWGARFNEEFDDIFEIEEKVSIKLAEDLSIKVKELRPKADNEPSAVSEVLKGRYYLQQTSPGSLLKSESYFSKAIDNNPVQPEALVNLARIALLKHANDLVSVEDCRSQIDNYLSKLLSINKASWEAHDVTSSIRLFLDWDFIGALKASLKACATEPQWTARLRLNLANVVAKSGHHERAYTIVKNTLRRDPLLTKNEQTTLAILFSIEQFGDCLTLAGEMLDLDPQNYAARLTKAMALCYTGELEGSLREILIAESNVSTPESLCLRGLIEARRGNYRGTKRILDRLLRLKNESNVTELYFCYLFLELGEIDLAFEHLARSKELRETNYVSLVSNPMLEKLRMHSSFREICSEMGLPIPKETIENILEPST